MLKSITLTLCLCATTAQACPTQADLATGIVVTEAVEGVDTYTKGQGNVVTQVGTFDDGWGYRNALIHGVYVGKLLSTDNGVADISSGMVTNYQTPPPIPEPSTTWTVETQIITPTEVYAETQTAKWGNARDMQIGDCTVTALFGTLTYENDLENIHEKVVYLPDLGISLLLQYQVDDTPPDNYSYIAIEAAK